MSTAILFSDSPSHSDDSRLPLMLRLLIWLFLGVLAWVPFVWLILALSSLSVAVHAQGIPLFSGFRGAYGMSGY